LKRTIKGLNKTINMTLANIDIKKCNKIPPKSRCIKLTLINSREL